MTNAKGIFSFYTDRSDGQLEGDRETNQINKFILQADAGKRMAKCQM